MTPVKVDSKARVCVRQCFYSVPARYAGRQLTARIGGTAIEVADAGTETAQTQQPAATAPATGGAVGHTSGAALACAPANAHAEALAHAHFVTTRTGGHGAVRELCDLLLTASGHYATLLAQYTR